MGNLVGLAAALALPSVMLMMIFGQTRIFFTMSRDGLLPEVLSKVHPQLPHPARHHHHHRPVRRRCSRRCSRSGILADISNSGTLFAFFIVAARRDGAARGRNRTARVRSGRR